VDWPTRIHADPKLLSGNPVLRGTRLSVEFLLSVFAAGWTDEETEAWRSLSSLERQAELEDEALGVPYEELLRCLEEESRRSGKESKHGMREGVAC
jgi:hypothetical protein